MKSKPVESTERWACPPNALTDGMAEQSAQHARGTPTETNPPCTVLRSACDPQIPGADRPMRVTKRRLGRHAPERVAVERKGVGLQPLAAHDDAVVERDASGRRAGGRGALCAGGIARTKARHASRVVARAA